MCCALGFSMTAGQGFSKDVAVRCPLQKLFSDTIRNLPVTSLTVLGEGFIKMVTFFLIPCASIAGAESGQIKFDFRLGMDFGSSWQSPIGSKQIIFEPLREAKLIILVSWFF